MTRSLPICRRLFQHLEDRSQQARADLLLQRSLDNLLLKRARDNWSEVNNRNRDRPNHRRSFDDDNYEPPK